MNQDVNPDPGHADPLGGRLPLLDTKTLTGEQRTVYDRLTASFVPWADRSGFQSTTDDGRLIGPFNPVLFSPISLSFLDFQDAESNETSLSDRERQIIILSVGATWQCPYELYSHAAVARKAGFLQTDIEALTQARRPECLSEREDVAQRFALELSAERRVNAALYSRAERLFEPRGLLDMIYLAGAYFCICAILNTFEIPAPVSSR